MKRDRRSHKGIFDLEGRLAFITGGAGLLGRKHAEAIAEFGGSIALADVRGEAAREVAESIAREFGVEAIGIEVDITGSEAVAAAARSVVGHFGHIDILINNAAMTVKYGGQLDERYFRPFEEYPVDLWEKALSINLTGMFICSQHVGKVMCEQKKGVIINIASDVGLISPDHRIYFGETFNTPIAYSVTKAGVMSFTRYLATYWADKNIRVNTLVPAGVYDNQSPSFVSKLSSCIPLGRMADKDEYKGAIVFLASDASSYMTGANLVMDGGRTAW